MSHFLIITIILAWIPIAWKAIKELFHKKIGTEFFIATATLFALAGHQEHAIIIVLFIMLLAQYIEFLVERRTQSALESLLSLVPQSALIINAQGEEEKISIEHILPGMRVLVTTGLRIPVDGTIIDGLAMINEAPLTGESTPREKTVGAQVFAGSFVESGSITINTEHAHQETLFAKMTELLLQAEEKKAHIIKITDTVAAIFTPVILSLIIALWFFTHDFEMIITLLVFGSPLELALVTPLTLLSGTVAAFRRGILVKGGTALEHMAHIDTIIFDKTGTLTAGTPEVVHVISLTPTLKERDILTIAAIAEKQADHVFARAILDKAEAEGIKVPLPETYSSLAGHGVEITYNKQQYFVGNRHFIEAKEHAGVYFKDKAICVQETQHSIFYIASDHTILGKICLSDTLRPEAKKAIAQLQSDIPHVMLVSGDKQSVVEIVANELGIKEYYGNIFPEEKLTILENLQKKNRRVAMIGDGINDAPALKAAHVGIAMGAMGMEPAINAADIVLMTNDLSKIYFIRMLSKAIIRTIKQNLCIGFGLVHILGCALTFMHLVTPVQAAFFHAITDILILLNSARLINY